ncbi:hypothetical protein KW798_01570 [Candidatus Parcubacteria bacterium]|nr:hypothetical protein [Candidatus Parcubacteria bacterium]
MPKIEMAICAFVEIIIPDFDEWEIPDDYREVIKPHIASSPTHMYLPWPIEALSEAKDELSFSAMSGSLSEWVVTRKCHMYDKEEGLRIYIQTEEQEPENWKRPLNIYDILNAAKEGFMFESQKLITEVLHEAGLPSTIEVYEAIQKQ